MIRKIRNWVLGFFLSLLVLGIIVVVLLINPGLMYARETVYGNFTVYHNKPLNLYLIVQLDRATELLQTSELYDPNFRYDLCLNDGSVYPRIIKTWLGDSFAWGFYHQIVLGGRASFNGNYNQLGKHRWNLNQLIAHEAMHCQTFNTFGLLKSNPAAGIPAWKWEGYPEYISRRGSGLQDLGKNIEKLIAAESAPNDGWIRFDDHTGTSLRYYKYLLLVQFCMNIKKMTFIHVLHDPKPEEEVRKEMMYWYSSGPGQKIKDLM